MHNKEAAGRHEGNGRGTARQSGAQQCAQIQHKGRGTERVRGVLLSASVFAEFPAGYEEETQAEQHGNAVRGTGHPQFGPDNEHRRRHSK